MNLGVVAKPNAKGQIVIPKKFRDELGIDENVFLSVTLKGNGVFLSPLKNVISSKEDRELTIEILKKTAGAWAGDNWPETEKRRKKIELESTRKNRNAKW